MKEQAAQLTVDVDDLGLLPRRVGATNPSAVPDIIGAASERSKSVSDYSGPREPSEQLTRTWR